MTAESAVDPRIERTRRVVVQAAAELAAEQGYAGTTVDAIAERSGVARSTIYRHWPDLADLLAETFGNVCGVPDMADTGSFVTDLRHRASALARGLREEAWGRMLPSIVGGADHDDDLRRALHTFTGVRRSEAAAAAQRAADRGEIDGDQDLDAAMERFVAPFFFRRMMTDLPLDDAFVERQLRWLCQEVGAPYTPTVGTGSLRRSSLSAPVPETGDATSG